MSQTLARRSINAVKWNSLASIFQVVLGLVQTTVLARLLPVETFGIYAAAMSVLAVVGPFSNLGLGGAFIHRSKVSEDIDQTAALFFTLKLIVTIIWSTLVLLGIFLFVDPQQTELRTAFLVITFCSIAVDLTHTPRLYLTRQIQHRRMAILDVLDIIITSIVTIFLALNGVTLGALLASNIITASLNVIGLYLWRPVWRPRLAWTAEGVRYFIQFGSRNFPAQVLLSALDRFDDIWTGVFLGTQALGFYSRAYRFAKMPSVILAAPVNAVASGTYAEIKEDRAALSQAFERINALMVRSGFLIAGLIAVIAPEFILIVLGEKWLPMLDAFRLMLVFTLFDPMKQTIASLFITGLGKPGLIVRFRLIQLAIMLIGLFALGIPYGIAGVALAVNVMLVTGIALAMWHARAYVDFSLSDMFKYPLIALCAALITSTVIGQWTAVYHSDWITGSAKGIGFLMVYGLVLLAWDRKQMRYYRSIASTYLFRRRPA